MLRFKLASALAAALLVSACTSTTIVPLGRGLVFYDRTTFAETLKRDMPGVTGEVVQQGRCQVYVSTPDNNVGLDKMCVFALTKDAVYLASWNPFAAKYENLMTIPFKGVSQVAFTSFGSVKQVQLTEDKRLVGIAMVNDDATGIEPDGAAKAFEFIKTAGVPEGKSIRGVIFSASVISYYTPTQIYTQKK